MFYLGNAHLVYAIIRKRNIFHQLANLPTDPTGIKKPGKQNGKSGKDSDDEDGFVKFSFLSEKETHVNTLRFRVVPKRNETILLVNAGANFISNQ